MARVALIVSAGELHRQPYSDVRRFYESCVEDLRHDDVAASVDVVGDDRVAHVLDGVDPAIYRCLVFASNAMVSPTVAGAVDDHAQALRTFLEQGGGVVAMHQVRNGMPSFLKEHFGFDVERARPDPPGSRRRSRWSRHRRGLERRGGEHEPVLTAGSGRDVLLHHPSAVELDHGRKLFWQDRGCRNPRRMFWDVLPAGSLGTLHPVLTGVDAGDVVVARSTGATPGRAVVSTIPLDWHGEAALVRNAISFAMWGAPQVLQIGGPEDGSAVVARTLGHERHLVRTASDRDAAASSWLLDTVEMVVAPLDVVTAIERAQPDARPELLQYVRAGGAVVASRPSSSPGTALVAGCVGPHVGRALVDRLLAALGSVTDWGEQTQREHTEPFALRNIVAARATAAAFLGARAVPGLPSGKAAAVLQTALRELERTHDTGSAIVRAETIGLLTEGGRERRRAVKALLRHRGPAPETTQLWLDAVLSGLQGSDERQCERLLHRIQAVPADGDAVAVTRAAVASTATLAAGVRRAAAGGTPGSAAVRAAAAAAAKHLVVLSGAVQSWPSVEARAEVVRGLMVAHLSSGSPSSEAEGAVATHLPELRRAINGWDAGRHGFGLLAVLVECALLVERAFPEGVDRFVLPRPTAGAPTGRPVGWPPARGEGETLNTAMRVHNEELQEERRALERRAASREQAARLWQRTATSCLAVLVAVAVLLVARRVADQGIDEVNVALITALGGALLAGARIFDALRKRGLMWPEPG